MKQRRLFDASAMLNLAINRGSEAIDATAEGTALTLTFYEIGNSVWKLHHLLKRLSDDEASSLLELSVQLLDRLNILKLEKSDAMQVEKLASLRGITFYDSAYLYAARRNELVLVTDDQRLRKMASGRDGMESISSGSL